jgi:hypothetical protein
MSQHYFNTTFDGEPVTVILGRNGLFMEAMQ